MLIRHTKIRPVIIGGLCKNTAPINRIDCTEFHTISEFLVSKRSLYNILTIVKCSFNRYTVNVGIRYSCHLSLLNFRHASIREKDDAVNSLLSAKTVNSGRAGISGGCAKYCKTPTIRTCFKEVFEKISEHLQGNIFERKCWSMEKFQNVVSPDLNNRCYILSTECSTTSLYNIFQLLSRNLILLNKLGNDIDSKVGVRKRTPALDLLHRNLR
mmetsp:Transcript_25803/g.39543  ORF Transcript_25803/g.39543 Transcript_25803/m.39543 type:complete len:213 (+) Transcript_25803:1197-1835(+)